jgi:hypothetical protein
MTEFPALAAEIWYSGICELNSLSLDRQGVRNVSCKDDVNREIRDPNAVFVQRISGIFDEKR